MIRKTEDRKGRARLPRFRSDREAAAFFETHDAADYWDQMADADDVIELAPRLVRRIRDGMRKRLLALRLEEWQIRRAKQIARSRHVPYQQLMREWISRGIRAEGSRKRRAE